jgi:lysophospholipase
MHDVGRRCSMKNVVRLTACLLCAFLGALPASGIDEKTFAQEFPSRVRPWFEASRRTGELRASDGLALRWYSIEAPSERAALVVLPGWTELAESYAEELFDLRDLGLSFYVLDHRCQGLSDGEISPRDRWYLGSWQSMLSDLDLFMEQVVRSRAHAKTILYGNSMGGALAVTYLERHPETAQALVITVPMFSPRTAPFPLFAVSATAGLYKLFGQGRAYLPGYGPYARYPFEGNPWSITSRARYEYLDWLNESRPEYQLGGTTAQGGLELLRLGRAAREAAAGIKVPALLVQAGRDEAVRNDAQDRAMQAMRDCRLVRVEEAHHIIMHAEDSVRGRALAVIRQFLGEQLE